MDTILYFVSNTINFSHQYFFWCDQNSLLVCCMLLHTCSKITNRITPYIRNFFNELYAKQSFKLDLELYCKAYQHTKNIKNFLRMHLILRKNVSWERFNCRGKIFKGYANIKCFKWIHHLSTFLWHSLFSNSISFDDFLTFKWNQLNILCTDYTI